MITDRDPIVGWEAIGQAGHSTRLERADAELAWHQYVAAVDAWENGTGTREQMNAALIEAEKHEALSHEAYMRANMSEEDAAWADHKAWLQECEEMRQQQ
jgi:hypothetical protein